jgi:predicted PurR-regulated permease PerM
MLSNFWDSRAARVLSTILIFAAVLGFLHAARETLTLFLFAILFAYFVAPLVGRLQKPLRGRVKAIAAVYVLMIGVLIALGFLIGPRVADEGRELTSSLPGMVDNFTSGEYLKQLSESRGWGAERTAQIHSFFTSHRGDLLSYGKALAAKLANPVQHIWWLILIPILSLFFLKDGSEMADGVVQLGKGPQQRVALLGIVNDVNVMLGSYIRAQLILAALTMVAYTLVLSLLRVPYAFILGPLAGIFEFVPVVGPAVAAVLVFAVAALTGYDHLVWLILFLGTWRLIQDYVNSPRIMGKSLEISPIIQIFAVLAGGEIAGVVGALISVPVVAILRILWRRLSSGRGVDEEVVNEVPSAAATTA